MRPKRRLETSFYRHRLLATAAVVLATVGASAGFYPYAKSGHAQTNRDFVATLAQMRRVETRSESAGHYRPASAIVADLERRGVAAAAVNNLELADLKGAASDPRDATTGLIVSGDATHLRLDRFVDGWDVYLAARPGQPPATYRPAVAVGPDYQVAVYVFSGFGALICLTILGFAEGTYRERRRALLKTAAA